MTRHIYVVSLYEQGEFEKALEVIERVGGATEVSSRDAKLGSGGLLDAALHPRGAAGWPLPCPAGLQGELWAVSRKDTCAIFNQATLLLLGRREEAMAASRELRNHPERLTGLSREHYLRILDYCGGDISEEEFLKAEAGSRWNQCEAHFYVALDRLAKGTGPAPASTSRRPSLRECSGL